MPQDQPTRSGATRYTVFRGHSVLLRGTRAVVVQGLAALPSGSHEGAPLMVIDDSTGGVIDIDQRDIDAARLSATAPESGNPHPTAVELPPVADLLSELATRGRGRPRLGVVPREVTLLPAHWDWLASQPGGASITLRRLVESARKSGEATDQRRRARDAAYQAMHALGGDLPGFEEASRALFADDRARVEAHLVSWPVDVRDYVLSLAPDNGDA